MCGVTRATRALADFDCGYRAALARSCRKAGSATQAWSFSSDSGVPLQLVEEAENEPVAGREVAGKLQEHVAAVAVWYGARLPQSGTQEEQKREGGV
ncbi:hypothetical protein OUZ56_016528 [Daphnia magna]|uniref:Uncharacterized protein n=1 Tax=Daphnia magna TaxID=35525 RepID=A0ABR0AQU3_9CRUS|nr:hypothetical protein OUZ56_016528 [Daphnia magna]